MLFIIIIIIYINLKKYIMVSTKTLSHTTVFKKE